MRIWPDSLGILLFALAACTASAQEPSRLIPPSIVSKTEPEYSLEAREAGLEGEVVLRVVIGIDGKPKDLNVVRGLGMGLDEKAVAAVSGWQFQPGAKNGQPVVVKAQIQVNFRLLEKGRKPARWHLARAEFHVADGAVRPFVKKGKAPHASTDPTSATATLKFDIDEEGLPVNVQSENSSDDGWARDVTDALREWKFTPATKDGMPVSASCTMEFVRGNTDHLAPPLDTPH